MLMRRGTRAVLAVAVSLLLVLFAANWLFTPFVRLPTLAQNLSTNIQEADAEFDRRVRERFASGASEAEIVAELSSQGFAPDSDSGDGLLEKGHIVRVYSFRFFRFPCD